MLNLFFHGSKILKKQNTNLNQGSAILYKLEFVNIL